MRLFMMSSIATVLLGLAAQQAAAIELTGAVGRTKESTSTVRIGLQKEFQSRWWQTDVGALTGYWDAGYTFWKGDKSLTITVFRSVRFWFMSLMAMFLNLIWKQVLVFLCLKIRVLKASVLAAPSSLKTALVWVCVSIIMPLVCVLSIIRMRA